MGPRRSVLVRVVVGKDGREAVQPGTRAPGGSRHSFGFAAHRAASSSAATASKSRYGVDGPGSDQFLNAGPRRSHGVAQCRARVRPASSGADASSVVSRSSTAETRLDPTAQPPATWSAEPACRSSGMSTRANQATSSSVSARSALHARRRRALTRSGTATATASATAARSHHNHEGAPVVAADDLSRTTRSSATVTGSGSEPAKGSATPSGSDSARRSRSESGSGLPGVSVTGWRLGSSPSTSGSASPFELVTGWRWGSSPSGSVMRSLNAMVSRKAGQRSHSLRTRRATAQPVRPTARITSGSDTAVSNPAPVVMSSLSLVLHGRQGRTMRTRHDLRS